MTAEGDDGQTIVGRAPTVADDGLDEAIMDLAPHKALARVDAFGHFIFANVAVIGTLVGALGVIASTQARPAPRELGGIPLVVLLVGLSLLFALIAVMPWLFRLNTDNRTKVRQSYSLRIVVRGSAAMIAGVLLAGAIVAAVEGATQTGVAASLSGQLSGAGDEAKATMSVEVTGLSQGDKVTATLTDVSPGAGQAVLCRSESTGDAAAKATLGCTVDRVGESAVLRVAVSVVRGTKTLSGQYLDIRR